MVCLLLAITNSTVVNGYQCMQEECAWWVVIKDREMCAIKALALQEIKK